MTGMTAPHRSALGLVVLAFGLLVVTPADAWAYIDPGTGSYLFQLAAAGLLAGIYTIRRHWYALLGALRGRPAGAGPGSVNRANDME